MNAAEMIAGIPYIVTRGSAALHLVAGDRVEVCVGTGSLIDQRGVRRHEWRGAYGLHKGAAAIAHRRVEG